MKKELFAGALLALLLGLALLNTRAIGDLCRELTDLVDRSADAAREGDWETSQSLLEDAVSLWKRREGYAAVVLRHTDIETLTDDFYELTEHIYTQDAGAAASAALLVREHLRGIAEMESVRLGSIF